MKTSTLIARVVLIGLLFAASTAVAQQDYPNKTVRIVVPFPPGGSTDPMARMVAGKFSERWGQTVVVDNRPGGNTIIGNSVVAKAPPDGYTMGWGGASLLSTPNLIPHLLPYDVVRDFVGVTTVAKSRIVLVLNPSVPANNLQELIALAKSKPGQLNYGSSGIGTNVHLSGALFCLMTGVNIEHIPYKGSGPLSTDLLGGRVHLSFQVPITVLTHINNGKLRPIAITGESRLPALPNVPTFSEVGMPGYGLTGWSALIAPTGTPPQVLNKIANDMASILSTPETLDFLTKQGAEPFISTPEQTTALIKSDIARYGKIIKEAGIKSEQ
jgi:tripartite-type tricarboxylate transporter receptor subunit TctC